MAVTHKTEVGPINGTPVKRMFWSIISDYNLRTGLCELIDNALDLWRKNGKKNALHVDVDLNVAQQVIRVVDNAGGVKQEDLQLLVVPGGSKNAPDAHLIGIFGVGSKRAGIALGEDVLIRTRSPKGASYEIEIAKNWLENDDWILPYYEIPDIKAGTTIVEISHLRTPLTAADVDKMRAHLGATYDWFIRQGCQIKLNGPAVIPQSFDTWAFPVGYSPKSAQFEAELTPGDPVTMQITGGLIRDRLADQDNYGVYFYCNERLIVKELRDHEVGYFVSSEAGVPHPDASLCRVIVRMEGPAQHMPWNSSKSGINFGHPAFTLIRPTLIQLTTHYSSLSRRLKHEWDNKVFPFDTGAIEEIEPTNLDVRNPLVLPPLPKVNKPRVEKLKTKNKKQIHDMPWTLGLVEAMDAVELVGRQRYETGNRIALILLDSTFEIALKEFIVHRDDLFPASQFGPAAIQQLFTRRGNVVAAIAKQVPIPPKMLIRAQHYYSIRNKLIHERATVDPTDADIKNYQALIKNVLKRLFDLSF